MAIKGGYYIKARQIKNSDIAHCAPVVREIWDYLLRECNHKESERLGVKRGQTVRTLADISEDLHWFVGYRKMSYSKTQCEKALKTLAKMHMATTTKTTRGLIITVCNYDTYQDPKNYEDDNEGGKKAGRRRQCDVTINKNEEECKESKEEIILAHFANFWDAYGKKIDRDKCEKVFMKLEQEDINKIIMNVPVYVANTPDVQYRKNPLTYLNGKCWNDEISVKPSKPQVNF